MKTTIQLEWTDYLAAIRLNARPSKVALVLAVIGGVIVAGFLIINLILSILAALQGELRPLFYFAIFVMMVGGMVAFGYFVQGPRNAKKTFEQTREMHGPMEVEVTTEGLKMTNPLGYSLRPWDFFRRWKENQRLFLLYLAENQILILPKRSVPDAMVAEIKRLFDTVPHPAPKRGFNVIGCVTFAVIALAIFTLLFQFRAQVP